MKHWTDTLKPFGAALLNLREVFQCVVASSILTPIKVIHLERFHDISKYKT